MNRRQWKKACKKAAIELQRRWPGQYEITPAQGDETVSPPAKYLPPGRKPPAGLARRLWNVGRHYANAPRGAPIIWTCDYWGECDCETALHALEMMEFVEATDWEAMWKAECEASQSTPVQ
jgi:hypothetical protein